MSARVIAVVVVLLGVGGGAWLWHAPRPAYASAEAALASPAYRAAAEEGDTVEIGRMALRQCRREGEPCYQAFLLQLAQEDRIATAMGALEIIAANDDRVKREGHSYAHHIGMRGFDPSRPVGVTFSTCTVNFQSGCYHGVIQAYLTSLDTIGPAEVAALCSDVPAVRESMWIRFQCDHGLGHGLVMYYDHHLPMGLAGCDLLGQPWDRESCYGGAFMENVIATDTHDMPVRGADTEGADGGSEHLAGMDHDHGMATPKRPPPSTAWDRINPADPQYPCSVLAEVYKRACYQMQTSLMLELTGYDFGRTAKMCDAAPVAHRTSCYQSLGTNIAGSTVRDIRESIRRCALGTERYQPWCYQGVVKNFIDVTSRPEDGFAFCAEMDDGPNRMMCYRAVGEELGILFSLADTRESWCDKVTGGYRESCRYGAMLTATAPEGMPRLDLLATEP